MIRLFLVPPVSDIDDSFPS